jgi:hypothetical protein
MKKISVLLALLALMFADLALAASAVATSVTGSAQVQTGVAPGRTLRVGDEVSQGDTVSTGGNSAVVLKFDDGQVAALTANSRMTITSYTYNPSNESGNVLLSLVTGGMRAITGLIGRRSPNQVAYRAATATIGIRGTDGTIATNGKDVVVTVIEGVMSLSEGNQVHTIAAGQAFFFRLGLSPISGPIDQVVRQLPLFYQPIQASLYSINLAGINTSPRQGPADQTDQRTGSQTPGGAGTPGGGTGGGTASPH